MELSVFKRSGIKKSENTKIRIDGGVPAVIYGKKQNENIYINKMEMETVLRNLPKGSLSTTVFELKGIGKAIIKEIQYHPTSYNLLHVDFALLEKAPIKVKVPITVIGEDKCPGIKLGGVLRKVIRSVKVRCLPEHMPKEFVVDIAEMNLGDSKRLSDIAIPSNIVPMVNLGEVAIVIAKR